jgi:hypothetical protein
MKQFVCGLRFNERDPDDKIHSMAERNFYVWIPKLGSQKFRVSNHRLTLRKNLVTGKYEVYRAFKRPFHFLSKDSPTKKNLSGKEKVVYRGTLRSALRFGNNEHRRYHGRALRDEPCKHKPPRLDPHCPRRTR